MRIGIDARFYGTLGKGLGRYTEKLITYLERLESVHEYFIFLRRENYDEFVPTQPNFHKVVADFQWYGWQEQILFPRLLVRSALDLVHFPHFNVPLFYRRPFVVTIHDLILLHFPTVKASELPPLLYWGKYLAYRFTIASAIRRARAILTVSEFTRQDIGKEYPEALAKVSVTREAADPFCAWVGEKEAASFLKRVGILHPDEKGARDILQPYCLYVGNAYPHKNLSLLLEAARAFPTVFFVLVGKEDYFYREIKSTVRDKKLKNVIFTGFVPDRFLDVLYQKARVYIFPSFYEGFGLPALEACSRGLPVLASNRTSLPEILGEAASFFDPENTEDFLSLLSELLTDEEKRAFLSHRGYRQCERFSWKKLASDTLALYEKTSFL